MCGISVILDWRGSGDLTGDLNRMHRQIPHRGPDGEGFLVVDARGGVWDSAGLPAVPGPARVGLGFRWLQIQDLDRASRQPMASPDRKVFLVYNGEIYNYAELREELSRQGFAFRTRSDTEVVLNAYRAWGTEAFARFNGIWALAIVDLTRMKLLLSRDRFGIKPLFYKLEAGRLLAASEAKQIVALQEKPAPSPQALLDFLRGRRWPAEETCFESVNVAPPASFAEVHLAREEAPRWLPYWSLEDHCGVKAPTPAWREACHRLDQLLQSAVELQGVAAVPVGSLLSGGIDSTTLAAFLSRSRGAPRTFSFSLGGFPGLDESPYIDVAADHLGARSSKVSLDPRWIASHLGSVSRIQEEPLGGMALLAQYRVYELAAAHGVRVVLDGQGADEILGGYPRHQAAFLRDRWAAGRWLSLFLEAGSIAARDPWRLASILRDARRSPSPDGSLPDYVTSTFRGAQAKARPEEDACSGSSLLRRALHRDVTRGNLRAVLEIGDRSSMAHSVESRVPFLDHRVVEWVFGLPDTYLLGFGQRKRLLREVGRRYLPGTIVHRRDRIGFGCPQERWLRRELRAEVEAAVGVLGKRCPALLDPVGVERAVKAFYDGNSGNAALVWRLYALASWCEAYKVELS